jgi:hypothetical protein
MEIENRMMLKMVTVVWTRVDQDHESLQEPFRMLSFFSSKRRNFSSSECSVCGDRSDELSRRAWSKLSKLVRSSGRSIVAHSCPAHTSILYLENS